MSLKKLFGSVPTLSITTILLQAQPVALQVGRNQFQIALWSFRSVQSLSPVQLFTTLWTVACARLPCSSPAPKVYLDSYPSSRWCHPAISSSCISFSSCLQSFPASGSFLLNQFFTSGGQSIGVFSFSICPSNEYSGLISFRIDWFDLLAVQGTLKSLLQHHSSKTSILHCSDFFIVQLSHPYMTTKKTIALTRQIFVTKVMCVLFNKLSRLIIAFLPRSKHLLRLWLQSPSAVILEPRKIVFHCFHCFPIYLPWSDGTGCHDLRFWMLSFKPTFLLSALIFIKRLFSSSSFSAIRVVSSAYLRLLIFLLAILIPACASSSPAFLMMYSAYKLNSLDILLFLFGTSLLFHVQF